MFSWQRFSDEVDVLAPAILDAGAVPGPPVGPFERGAAYPLAVDIDGDLGVVSFAALDPYPDIEAGWWCFANMFVRSGAGWSGSVSTDDNTTSPTPFTRPLVAENGPGWLDWGSNCGLMGWGTGTSGSCASASRRSARRG